jgi:hypothetical protein
VNLGSQWHLLVVFSFFIVNGRKKSWQQKLLFTGENYCFSEALTGP